GVDVIVAGLRALSKPISGTEQVARVATVAAGNDAGIGSVVADAFERVGAAGGIVVAEGGGLATTVGFVGGIRFEGGCISPDLVDALPTMGKILEDAYILILEKTIVAAEDLVPILEKVEHAGKPLVIIAEGLEGPALDALIDRNRRGSIEVAAVR